MFLGELCRRTLRTASHDAVLIIEDMTGLLPGSDNGEASSSSRQTPTRHSLDELDDDEAADLSLDKALLAEDPLESGNGKAPLVKYNCVYARF